VDGITSFSIAPLRLASVVGGLTAAAAFLYAIIVFVKTMLFGDPVAGFPTMIIMVSFLGGMQLLAIGLLGEYVGRLLVESKQRPHYFVDHIDLPEVESKAAHPAQRRPSAIS
jgi:hypothetical protein